MKIAKILICCSALLGGWVSAQEPVPQLQVTGYGEVTVEPDMAEFSVAVEQRKPTAQQAKQAVDAAVAAFVDRMQEEGIERSAIRSANIQLQPQYQYLKDQAPELIGYRAYRQVQVTVAELDKLNGYLDAALGDGINQINQIELKASEQSTLQEQARQVAIKDALSKAESLARGFGEEIAGVWRITYQQRQPRPMVRATAMEAKADVAGSYQDGEIVVSDQVSVVFRLQE